jgi:hypothetical protein
MKTSITLFILSGILAYIGSEVVVSQGVTMWFVLFSFATGVFSIAFLAVYLGDNL